MVASHCVYMSRKPLVPWLPFMTQPLTSSSITPSPTSLDVPFVLLFQLTELSSAPGLCSHGSLVSWARPPPFCQTRSCSLFRFQPKHHLARTSFPPKLEYICPCDSPSSLTCLLLIYTTCTQASICVTLCTTSSLFQEYRLTRDWACLAHCRTPLIRTSCDKEEMLTEWMNA